MEPVTFRVTDNSKNRKKFILKTDGINVDLYKDNNVVLFNHQLDKPIGIANYYSDNLSGYADIYFDEDDEFAMGIMKKVKKGHLKTTSVGFAFNMSDVELNEDGVPVILKSELREISITPIPANPNAVVVNKSDKSIKITNSVELSDDVFDTMVYLNAEVDSDELFNNLKPIKNKSMEIFEKFNVTNEEELLLKFNQLETSLTEKDTEILQLNSSITEKETVINELNNKLSVFELSVKESEIDNAIKEGKFNEKQKESLMKLSVDNFDLVKEMIENAKVVLKPEMNLNFKGNDAGELDLNWTLDEWRQKNPTKLADIFKNDKKEYERILNIKK